jgi:AAA15 family ATPase/GTPase
MHNQIDRHIETVEVEKLFGHYNYKVEKSPSDFANDPLMIIYGDNGTGKTTLLELIFYLVSTADNEGHKSKVAEIKFKKISILLNNGVEIIAERDSESLIGSYHYIIREKKQVIHNVCLEADSDFSIRMKDRHSDDVHTYYNILEYINNLNINIHYLSDSRKLIAGVGSRNKALHRLNKRDEYLRYKRQSNGEFYEEEKNDLEVSVKKLEGLIRNKVLLGSKTRDLNTNTIYTDLIKRVTSQRSSDITSNEVLNLVQKLKVIRSDNKKYQKYGLVSKIETSEIESTLQDPSLYNADLIYNILEPYVEGLRGRLDSLKGIQEVIELFVSQLNDYFTNKEIKYHLAKGFNISDKEFGGTIELSMLSSGEKQLLLLFCSVITSSDNASVFIIDEPEISLNIKWQRKLVQTLLDFSKNKNVQFIFASHSIELLTSHKDSVSKLQHIRDK